MFSLGFPEIFLMGTVALLVFGPKRIPELALGLGKGIRDFKKAISWEREDPVQIQPCNKEVENSKVSAIPTNSGEPTNESRTPATQ